MAMIKRIKEIKNIGVFSDFKDGGKISFKKLTFIYGLNTYGKTTLTDIFQSLKSNDSGIIISRKTIPENSESQKVVFSVTENDSSEKKLSFQNGGWEENSVSQQIEIFGTDFIHKNIFTGLTIERKNKENFTKFVLGEQGVSLAKQIREKRQELGNKKKDLKNKVPSFVKGKSEEEIKEFLELSIDGLIEADLDAQLLEKKNSLNNEKERLKEPSKILNMEEPKRLEISKNNILETLNSLNDLFTKDYSNIKESSMAKLNQHLSSNFSGNDGAETWIKSGLHFCKNVTTGSCPFCGQSLESVRDLIELYNSYFDEEYNAFIFRITDELTNNNSIIESINFSIKSTLQTAFNVINQYKGLITSSEFQSNLLSLDTEINSLQEDELNCDKGRLFSLIKNRTTEKLKSPYQKVEKIEVKDFEENVNKYYDSLNNSDHLIEFLIKEIKNFKKQYEDLSIIQKSIDELDESIAHLGYKRERVKLDSNCAAYVNLKNEIIKSEEEIKKLDDKLREDQSAYVDKYFRNIDPFFQKLGSKNFTLEKEIDNRGHLPVYSLKIKFRDVNIQNDKLNSVFSESDKRALALSVFLAKLDLKSEKEKLKTIVILDDPITSFDDNRIIHSTNIFKNILNEVNQLIVLTHYSTLIKRFYEIMERPQIDFQFIELKSNKVKNYLESSNIKQFISSTYEKVFSKIYGFINRTHSDDIKTDLRPFLENLYLPMMFAKKIKDKNIDCSSLKGMINGIFDDNEGVKSRFHTFRTSLNPDSHLFTENNEEDVRSFASDMMDYLYSLKF